MIQSNRPTFHVYPIHYFTGIIYRTNIMVSKAPKAVLNCFIRKKNTLKLQIFIAFSK